MKQHLQRQRHKKRRELLTSPITFPFFLPLLIFFTTIITPTTHANEYLIGTGIHDITGPPVQINFMGYAVPSQTGRGIHLRLRSRAIILSSTPSCHTPPPPNTTICIVVMDSAMGSDLLTTLVLSHLPPSHVCNRRERLSISGTHTHSANGGFLPYALYQFTSRGYVKEVMDVMVNGIVKSLVMAEGRLECGSVEMGVGMLYNASVNRSPSSYLMNPREERESYGEEEDVDNEMLLLRFRSSETKEIGSLNWFAVHGTSMNNTNRLLSGDNKGYAAYLTERHFNPDDSRAGSGPYVAAYASSNLGDVSPNIRGGHCLDSGLRCDGSEGSCHGRIENCVASGPGRDMMESTAMIGRRQHDFLLGLYNRSVPLEGGIRYIHTFIDMSNRTILSPSGETILGRTCPAALGYAFAAGTTDGPGMFNFSQGTTEGNPFWDAISGFLSKPSQEQVDCHHPKPILLNTGDLNEPYAWDPASVPLSLFQIGGLLIVNVPAEFTTMAGRRLRRTLVQTSEECNGGVTKVVIMGLANSYTHYVTTYEEYQGQRYEAASTLYGPWTLRAYQDVLANLARDLFEGREVASECDDAPDVNEGDMWSFVGGVPVDEIPIGKKFGEVSQDANDVYHPGDTVTVSFHSANPRNNQRGNHTFLQVQRQTTTTTDDDDGDSNYQTVFDDGDWCTQFEWEGSLRHHSTVFVRWIIPEEEEGVEGNYRICHYGTRKLGDEKETMVHVDEETMNHAGVANAERDIRGRALRRQRRSDDGGVITTTTNRNESTQFEDFQGCSKIFFVTMA